MSFACHIKDFWSSYVVKYDSVLNSGILYFKAFCTLQKEDYLTKIFPETSGSVSE